MSARAGRHRPETGNVLLVLSAIALGLALAGPWIQDASLRRRAEAVVSDVEAIRAAALRHRAAGATWPSDAEPGVLPAELLPFVPEGVRMIRPARVLDWDRWETVRPSVARVTAEGAPPPTGPAPADGGTAGPYGEIAGITVHTTDTRILGRLLDRYGTGRTFVRDSSWTLVLIEEDDAR